MDDYFLGGYKSLLVKPPGKLNVISASAAKSGNNLMAVYKLRLPSSASNLSASPTDYLMALGQLSPNGALMKHDDSQACLPKHPALHQHVAYSGSLWRLGVGTCFRAMAFLCAGGWVLSTLKISALRDCKGKGSLLCFPGCGEHHQFGGWAGQPRGRLGRRAGCCRPCIYRGLERSGCGCGSDAGCS